MAQGGDISVGSVVPALRAACTDGLPPVELGAAAR